MEGCMQYFKTNFPEKNYNKNKSKIVVELAVK